MGYVSRPVLFVATSLGYATRPGSLPGIPALKVKNSPASPQNSRKFRCQKTLHFYSAPQCSHFKRCTSYGNSVCLSVCPSVCPSVRHTPVLCQNDGT